jgi:hypothetical protein
MLTKSCARVRECLYHICFISYVYGNATHPHLSHMRRRCDGGKSFLATGSFNFRLTGSFNFRTGNLFSCKIRFQVCHPAYFPGFHRFSECICVARLLTVDRVSHVFIILETTHTHLHACVRTEAHAKTCFAKAMVTKVCLIVSSHLPTGVLVSVISD